MRTILVFMVLASQIPSPPRVVDDAALGNEANGDNWLAYGRTYSEQRFSPLTQISDASISRLRPGWVLELPGDRGLVSTPLVVNGVLYFVGSMNVVRAVDAASGSCSGSTTRTCARTPGGCAPAGITTAASASGKTRSTPPPGMGGWWPSTRGPARKCGR